MSIYRNANVPEHHIVAMSFISLNIISPTCVFVEMCLRSAKRLRSLAHVTDGVFVDQTIFSAPWPSPAHAIFPS